MLQLRYPTSIQLFPIITEESLETLFNRCLDADAGGDLRLSIDFHCAETEKASSRAEANANPYAGFESGSRTSG